jgi:hypothetical protein
MVARHRIGWGLFGLQVLAMLIWAIVVHRSDPEKVVSGDVVGPARVRFGMPERDRRRIFEEVVAFETLDQAEVRQKAKEEDVWNRNFDDYFHHKEFFHYVEVARRHHIPYWEAMLIVDEGLRGHWPPPPGITLHCDDAPLAPITRPLEERCVISASAPLPQDTIPNPTLKPGLHVAVPVPVPGGSR